MTELLSCPFCGEKPNIIYLDIYDKVSACDEENDYVKLFCLGECLVSFGIVFQRCNEANIIKMWNTRVKE